MPGDTKSPTPPREPNQHDPVPDDQDSRRLRAALRGTFPASDPAPSWAGPPKASDDDEDEDAGGDTESPPGPAG